MTDQPTLFDVPAEAPDTDAPRLRAMRGAYGRMEGRTCGECAYLVIKRFHDGQYLKCAKYGDSQGPGTDWRRKWPACGLWEAQDLGQEVRG